MMDTILNLGLNDETVLTLAQATKNERFAWTAIAGSFRCMATLSRTSKTPARGH
jgi:hypothetical protein